MSAFFELDCGGEAVTLEKTDDGDIIFHGWDEETELAAIELGFEPSTCLMLWNAINDGILDRALHAQVRKGNALLAEALLFVGASVNARGISDWTPLHYAAFDGRENVVRILLKAGASVDAKDNPDWTPLHYVAMWGQADIAKVLLEAGASVDAKNYSGYTPLHIALEWGKPGVVKTIQDWIKEHGE